jgi:hypothetical protein
MNSQVPMHSILQQWEFNASQTDKLKQFMLVIFSVRWLKWGTSKLLSFPTTWILNWLLPYRVPRLTSESSRILLSTRCPSGRLVVSLKYIISHSFPLKQRKWRFLSRVHTKSTFYDKIYWRQATHDIWISRNSTILYHIPMFCKTDCFEKIYVWWLCLCVLL